MRYHVYKWDQEDVKRYEDSYGEGSFESDMDSNCFDTITSFGTEVTATDDRQQADMAADDALASVGMYGQACIWDSQEHKWSN